MNISHAHSSIPSRECLEELFNLVASSFIISIPVCVCVQTCKRANMRVRTCMCERVRACVYDVRVRAYVWCVCMRLS